MTTTSTATPAVLPCLGCGQPLPPERLYFHSCACVERWCEQHEEETHDG